MKDELRSSSSSSSSSSSLKTRTRVEEELEGVEVGEEEYTIMLMVFSS